jgi:hypothetical protein
MPSPTGARRRRAARRRANARNEVAPSHPQYPEAATRTAYHVRRYKRAVTASTGSGRSPYLVVVIAPPPAPDTTKETTLKIFEHPLTPTFFDERYLCVCS